MEDRPESSTTDEKVDGEKTMARMNASPNSRRYMEPEKPLNLLQGKRLGWWSSRKFDRRVRMRVFVMEAVNDEHTKILLDIGANISTIIELSPENLSSRVT